MRQLMRLLRGRRFTFEEVKMLHAMELSHPLFGASNDVRGDEQSGAAATSQLMELSELGSNQSGDQNGPLGCSLSGQVPRQRPAFEEFW